MFSTLSKSHTKIDACKCLRFGQCFFLSNAWSVKVFPSIIFEGNSSSLFKYILMTKSHSYQFTFFQTSPCFYVSALQVFFNTVRKGEIARHEQFLLFPQCFTILFGNSLPFLSNSKLSSADSFSLEEFKICCLGKSSWETVPQIFSLLYRWALRSDLFYCSGILGQFCHAMIRNKTCMYIHDTLNIYWATLKRQHSLRWNLKIMFFF